MATWVRSFTADLTGTIDLDLTGPADLDNDTVPSDWDGTAVNSVRFQFTLSHTGTFSNDNFDLNDGTATGVEIETTGGTQLASVAPTGQINSGTSTVVVDSTDNSPNNTASNADWSGAQFNGISSGIIAHFNKTKGPDGVTPRILSASVTITIDYTPQANPQQDLTGTLFTSSTTWPGGGTVASSYDLTGVVFTSATTWPSSGAGEITHVGSTISGEINGADVTITLPGTPLEGDTVVVLGGHSDETAAAGPSTAGYTEHSTNQVAGLPGTLGIWTKVMGATPDTQVVGRNTGNAADACSYAVYVLRGVDQTTPIDQTSVYQALQTSVTSFDPPSITTQTDGAWVIAAAVCDTASTWNSTPYNVHALNDERTDTNRFNLATDTTEVATAGAEDPGTFGMGGSGDGFGATFAIRPEPAGGTVATTYALTGVVFTSATTWPGGGTVTGGGAVQQDLTGNLFTSATTWPGGGTVTPGAVALTGTLFTSATTWPGGGTIGGTYPLTGTLFTSSTTWPGSGVVTGGGAQPLAGILFTSATTWPGGGTIDVGAVALTGNLFTSSTTWPGGGTVAQVSPLTGVVFTSATTWPGGGTISVGAVALTGVVFTSATVFHGGSIVFADSGTWQTGSTTVGRQAGALSAAHQTGTLITDRNE